jgi:hypothetical protein
MVANSKKWENTTNDTLRKILSDTNNLYAKQISDILGEDIIKKDGTWYIGDPSNGRKLYKYKTGGLVNSTGLAWLDGTPDKPELVLNSDDTKNFIKLTEALRETPLSALRNLNPTLPLLAKNAGATNIGDIHINIPIAHVDDYNDFITQVQNDKKFEQFIRSVSVDLVSGNNVLSKNKYKM